MPRRYDNEKLEFGNFLTKNAIIDKSQDREFVHIKLRGVG